MRNQESEGQGRADAVSAATKRLTITFSGYVQGVGFRYTTAHLAGRQPVTGYVKNLPDGDVECVLEGREIDMIQLLNELRSSHLGKCITSERLQWSEATGQFNRFSIAY